MRKSQIFILLVVLITACTYNIDVENSDSTMHEESVKVIGGRSDTIKGSVLQNEIIKSVSVAKWYNNKKAAVSLTYDIGFGTHESTYELVKYVIEKIVRIDFEFVSEAYINPKYEAVRLAMANELINDGIHFFGHGHKHINHDKLSFDSCYTSFKTCFDLMREWNLHPISYAYPGNHGRNFSTQLAVSSAGFISARGATAKSESEKYYICADEISEPENWFYLPSIVMGEGSNENVKSSNELKKYIDLNLEKEAWITILYHSIGIESGWAYYPLNEFKADVEYLVANDIWICNMDNATLYIKEKNNLNITTQTTEDEDEVILNFSDGLDNDLFSHPITLNFEFDNRIKSIEITPAIEDKSIFDLDAGKLSLNIIPNELDYKINVFR